MNTPFTAEDRHFQLVWRGRYVELICCMIGARYSGNRRQYRGDFNEPAARGQMAISWATDSKCQQVKSASLHIAF